MTDTHLQNTIQYVRRRRAKTLGLGSKSDPPIVKAMIEELKRRGIWRPTAEDVRGRIGLVEYKRRAEAAGKRRLVFDEFLEEVERLKRERTPRRAAAPKPAAPEPAKSPWARELDIESEKK